MKQCVSAAAVLCAMLAGCGGSDQYDVVPVKGTLYLDGKPHGPAQVALYPVPENKDDKRPALGGDVGADGKFTLTTYETGDGAPPGKYTVQLMGSGTPGSTDPAEMMAAQKTTPVKDSEITIPPDGTEKLEIRLESAGPAQGGSVRGPMLGL